MLLWDNDIGWCEKLQRELAKEGLTVAEPEEGDRSPEEQEAWWESLLLQVQTELCLAVVLSVAQLLDDAQARMSGMERLKWFCSKGKRPVILVAEEEQQAEELAVLQLGVRDYIGREKDIRILVQRILLCGREYTAPCLRGGPQLLLIRDRRCMWADGLEYALTPKEYLVIAALQERHGKLITRQELLHIAWGEQPPACQRVVDTIIKQLRGKLKKTTYDIKSRYGQGYYLCTRENTEA